ncbi:substrate-binding domain-containing protein [Variovorax sp. RA8]|uniref:helix-turn-helix transcriptional regulator n=1 Tax=Variovorax sp. (strain JCM 16519 / RA8) TaxID=662548 RepID=UPI00131789D3|nr:substrate-binding domain-containing protein [Variovorax sp. RA8]VTU32550.1 putative molybdopterin biosynthesis protein MoeA/LysR substrate binding-domain-containing protein [Variovorax sp. RA8]
MQQIELSYAIAPRRSGRTLIRNPLMELLHAVREHGSISAAARALGLSYRHVWGELKHWEQALGHPLVTSEQGRSAQLSEFGDKLLWAERQAQARLAPQIEALHADLERAFAMAFDDGLHVLSLHASHDDALVLLRAHAAERARLQLDIRFTGSVDAISALNQGRCVMAGFHTLERPPAGSLAQRTYKPLLKPGLHKLIGFARRTQGLIVAPGNPLGLRSIGDVARRRARYVNRALGTGTRVLLDDLLVQEGLDADALEGYARDEPSHTAVAHAVASGQADAGLGIESAARGADLGFVPLVHESYHLACLKSALDQPAVEALLALLRSAAWQHQLGTLAGYESAGSGEVQSLSALLPWWRFKGPKP